VHSKLVRSLDPARRDRRLRRLGEELADEGFAFEGRPEHCELLLTEVDYAMHPRVFERRVPSYGSIVEPPVDPPAWQEPTGLLLSERSLGDQTVEDARRFADGLSSWLVRRDDGRSELVVFDRPAGSERDLMVLAESTAGTLVQRHPTGLVRAVGSFGVLRYDGTSWQREPPVRAWIDAMQTRGDHPPGEAKVLAKLLAFAVHDLGARGIGALLILRRDAAPPPSFELRMSVPPPLQITVPPDLAPLRHVLSQIDGAAVFDGSGTVRHLGVRLVPSAEAEMDVEAVRGTRHTSARRYSRDDPSATVIVVSEDGPVTVFRDGHVLGHSQSH
jgi:hypothetical protein